MQKVKPAQNTINMDFLNSFDKPIGKDTTVETKTETETIPVNNSGNEVTEIDATDNADTNFEDIISIDDEPSLSKTIKSTQIVVRTTEKEREALKAYFMKHGVSISKGLKIAVKYLEQQEKKGLVHFSDIGIF